MHECGMLPVPAILNVKASCRDCLYIAQEFSIETWPARVLQSDSSVEAVVTSMSLPLFAC